MAPSQQSARFILGADLDLRVCERLLLIQKELTPIIKDQGGVARWIRPEHLGLTMKVFELREIALLDRIQSTIQAQLDEMDPFELAVSHVRAYPDGKTPRIIYAEVTRGREEAEALHLALEDALESGLGIARDPRPFFPYVTLGRVRTSASRVNLSGVLGALTDLPLGVSLIRDIALIESLMIPKGSQYQVRARAFFRGVRDPQG